jgi:hypothetical protein
MISRLKPPLKCKDNLDFNGSVKIDTIRAIVTVNLPPTSDADVAVIECGYCSCSTTDCVHTQHAFALLKAASQKQLERFKKRLSDRFQQSIAVENNLSLLRQVRGFRRLISNQVDSSAALQKIIFECIFDSLITMSSIIKLADPYEFCWLMDRVAAIFYLLQEAVNVVTEQTKCPERYCSDNSILCHWISVNLSKSR